MAAAKSLAGSDRAAVLDQDANWSRACCSSLARSSESVSALTLAACSMSLPVCVHVSPSTGVLSGWPRIITKGWLREARAPPHPRHGTVSRAAGRGPAVAAALPSALPPSPLLGLATPPPAKVRGRLSPLRTAPIQHAAAPQPIQMRNMPAAAEPEK